MKKLITLFAVGAIAAGSVFAADGDKKEGEKPKREKAEGDKGKGKGEKGKGKGKGGGLMALDTDKSGDVSFDEFKAGPRAKDKPEEQVKKYFDKMDKDGDGKISRADLDAIAKERGDKGKGKGDKGKGKGKGEKGKGKGEGEKKKGE